MYSKFPLSDREDMYTNHYLCKDKLRGDIRCVQGDFNSAYFPGEKLGVCILLILRVLLVVQTFVTLFLKWSWLIFLSLVGTSLGFSMVLPTGLI